MYYIQYREYLRGLIINSVSSYVIGWGGFVVGGFNIKIVFRMKNAVKCLQYIMIDSTT